MRRLLAIVMISALWLGACGGTPTPSPTSSGYPAPNPSAYPGPDSSTQPAGSPVPLISVIPTPAAPDKATVTGVLQLNPGAPEPVAGVVLCLADIIPSTAGTPWLASFDRKTSPCTQTDGIGRFVFADVLPVQHSLVLDRFSDSYLLSDPETGGDFIFTPQPGQILDLGNLAYLSLPSQTPVP